jgi:hypothetical protein
MKILSESEFKNILNTVKLSSLHRALLCLWFYDRPLDLGDPKTKSFRRYNKYKNSILKKTGINITKSNFEYCLASWSW